jgi:ATP-dependent Clp protease ATP-binding subunit ClpA
VATEQFTEAGRRVVDSAEQEARTLRHTRIGTEHLLLGVLSQPEEPGARALAKLGVTLGAARAQVMRIVGLPETPSPPALPITPQARDALAGALREAIELGRTTVSPEHVLLALLRERDSVAVRVLRDAGVDPRRLREEVGAAVAATAHAPSAGAGPAPPAPPAAGAPDPADGVVGAYALLGVLGAGGPAAELLRAHGIDEAAVSALLEAAARRR